MSYKILIAIILSNLLPIAYAMNKSEVPPSTFTAVESTTQALPPLSDFPDGQLNSIDPYTHCFTNSTWIVPPQTLLAYKYAGVDVAQAIDQTVWIISSYNQGYFFGQSYTAINASPSSERYLIGSVTSEGKIYITFYTGTLTSGSDYVTGLGVLNVKSSGQCSFIMQMNSAQNGINGLTHWSYMISVKPGDFFYNNLPGTGGMSVPEFLKQFS